MLAPPASVPKELAITPVMKMMSRWMKDISMDITAPG
jgi:hypothetical protein